MGWASPDAEPSPTSNSKPIAKVSSFARTTGKPPSNFTSREILILCFLKGGADEKGQRGDAEEPLIILEGRTDNEISPNDWSGMLLPGNGNQLRLPYHLLLTKCLWMLVVSLAISVPNLADVLDLVGCASGTLIAFVLPGLFSLQIRGYSTQGALLLGVGGLVGTIGTIFSLKKLLTDLVPH